MPAYYTVFNSKISAAAAAAADESAETASTDVQGFENAKAIGMVFGFVFDTALASTYRASVNAVHKRNLKITRTSSNSNNTLATTFDHKKTKSQVILRSIFLKERRCPKLFLMAVLISLSRATAAVTISRVPEQHTR